MEIICSLLPGGDKPLLTLDGDDVVYEEIEDLANCVEQVNPFPETTNGDNCVRSLPQPNAEMCQPLNLEIDPVSTPRFE